MILSFSERCEGCFDVENPLHEERFVLRGIKFVRKREVKTPTSRLHSLSPWFFSYCVRHSDFEDPSKATCRPAEQEVTR